MSFENSQPRPEALQDVLKSTMNIVNDDFDYSKFMKAFSQNDNTQNYKPSAPQAPTQWTNENNYRNNDTYSNSAPQRPSSNTDEVPRMKENQQQPFVQKVDYMSNDKLRNIMNEDNIRKAITDMANKNGVNMTVPTLKLQITGNPKYDLTENDVVNIFSNFGKILQVEISRHRTAYIVYADIINALFAQKSLNNQYIKHLDVKFYVSWSSEIDEDIFKPEEDTRPSNTVTTNARKFSGNDFPAYSNNTTSVSLPNLDALPPSFSYNSAKFTCKYEIQIETDKEFKVARKIIGPKGCNMKKIIDICQNQMKRSNLPFQNDFLKLRLRGQGSGFKEGPEQRESDDPLHLCVSSKYAEVYNLACKLVEDLISGLYREYEIFCQKAGRPLQEPVKIKRTEICGANPERKSSDENKVGPVKPRLNSIDYTLSSNFSKSLVLSDDVNPGYQGSTGFGSRQTELNH